MAGGTGFALGDADNLNQALLDFAHGRAGGRTAHCSTCDRTYPVPADGPIGCPRCTVRPCSVCGTRTTRNWCSTACHRADEPEAYGDER